MSTKEFQSWLEGYVQALDPNQITASTIATILGKARSIKEEPSMAENINASVKKILHG
jgi:hypothetical protein